MHLIGFIVPGQHMHDQIDPEAVGHFPLPFARLPTPDPEHRAALIVQRPCRSPVIAADHNRRHPIVQITERHAFGLFRRGRRRFGPDRRTGKPAGKIL